MTTHDEPPVPEQVLGPAHVDPVVDRGEADGTGGSGEPERDSDADQAKEDHGRDVATTIGQGHVPDHTGSTGVRDTVFTRRPNGGGRGTVPCGFDVDALAPSAR